MSEIRDTTDWTSEEHAVQFILEQIPSRADRSQPLFVGIQGPQGIGKSYLTNALHARLTSEAHSLKIAFLSLDDLYLPHDQLQALGQANPGNAMLSGRGLPGTHDLPLGQATLQALKGINTGKRSVKLPIYDKSLYAGQGDRSKETSEVDGPLDVVIFEGWMTGFYPIPSEILKEAYASHTAPYPSARPTAAPLGKTELQGPFFTRHSLEACLQINANLSSYVDEIWPFLDCFVQIGPVDPGFTYEWRLQQEHSMKAKNGGKGMTDEQVEAFVSRYMPAYELFGAGVQSGGSGKLPPWSSKGLRILVDKQRAVSTVIRF